MPKTKGSRYSTKQKRKRTVQSPPIRAARSTVRAVRVVIKVVAPVVAIANPSAPPAASPSPRAKTPIKTIFDVGEVEDPLIGTPKEVQKELDRLALYMQKHPEDECAFTRIHAYIHKYLLGLVFKKYSFVRGYDENDMYQESLIAISKKAIPNFNPKKGMSFLNFAKMCINRHLITILHASNHRRKDIPINQAISLDQCPLDSDEGNCLLSNVITDEKHSAPPYKDMANREALLKTLESLRARLSDFEIIVLEQYLQDRSYKEAARNITYSTGSRYNEKSVDNALLRIRKKAIELLKECNAEEMIPMLF